MKYFLYNPENQATTGPFELDEIKAKLHAGELPAETLAIVDIDESQGQVRSTPAEDWMPVQSIPGLGHERPANLPLHKTSPPPPITAADPIEQSGSEPSRPVSLLTFIAGVIGGLITQFFSFVMVCGVVVFGGFVTDSSRKGGSQAAIVVALFLCLGWVAVAIPMTRSAANRGFAFGVLLGVGLTALLTANCALR